MTLYLGTLYLEPFLQTLVPFGFHGLFHNRENIDVHRAMARTASATDTGDHPVFADVVRILVADLLAQTLIDFGARIVAAGFQGEIREHAGVPHTAAGSFAEHRLVANIETVAGRAHEGANAAA